MTRSVRKLRQSRQSRQLRQFGLPLAAALLAVLSWLAPWSDRAEQPAPASPPAPASESQGSADSGQWRARLLHAADGDSFTVRRADSGQKLELRLYGVDAPESDQAYGQAARRNLLAMTKGKVLTVKPVDSDQYGRVVAVVFTEGDAKSLNERQLEQGMAWYYDYFCREPFCRDWKAKEQQAREQRAGLWRDDQPQSPRQWRQNKSRRR